MRSALAQTIIEACLEAKAAGAVIPSCDRLVDIPWGIFSANKASAVYELNDAVCCPLGATLLGSKAENPDNFSDAAARFLEVDDSTISGILMASEEGFMRDGASASFQEGWAVGLEVLKWVNSQQKGA